MRSWLSVLPHQIPFRAASIAALRGDDTIEGAFLCTGNDALGEGRGTPELMLLEAMAQLAGGLAFQGAEGHGFLSGVEHWEIDRPIAEGEVIELVIRLEASFGGLFRFSGTGSIEGRECARGRFYLAAARPEVSDSP